MLAARRIEHVMLWRDYRGCSRWLPARQDCNTGHCKYNVGRDRPSRVPGCDPSQSCEELLRANGAAGLMGSVPVSAAEQVLSAAALSFLCQEIQLEAHRKPDELEAEHTVVCFPTERRFLTSFERYRI